LTGQDSSYRQILKSSFIIGGASIITIVVGLVRTKVLAMLLGPAGIGLVSLYYSLMQTTSTLATMGLGNVGTRQVAATLGSDAGEELSSLRRAMFWGAMLLAFIGALMVWSLREVLATHVLGGKEYSSVVGWLSVGVAFSVASASQGALIQGLRRIEDMARISVYGSILNTLVGLAVLWKWHQAGVVAFVLVVPLINFLLGHMYVLRLPKPTYPHKSIDQMLNQWQSLLRLGIPFMGAGLVSALVELWIRVSVSQTLGTESLGHFQAAWLISMQYIGFVLAAMGADYYPHLTSVINDHKASTRLVNEQTEVALLLSAPVFIVMIAFSPLVIELLYSSAFNPAAEILKWQILGDILKVASWPLGFVLLALGSGKTFFWIESFVLIFMGLLVAIYSSRVGVKITGIAFLISYSIYLPAVYFIARNSIGFKWTKSVAKLLTFVIFICILVIVLCSQYSWGRFASLVISIVFAFYSFLRLLHLSSSGCFLQRLWLGLKKQ
jgi:O-antigen/teichoic acid export membrane protein